MEKKLAQFLAMCSAYILAETPSISSLLRRPSREKREPYHGPFVHTSTNCNQRQTPDKLSGRACLSQPAAGLYRVRYEHAAPWAASRSATSARTRGMSSRPYATASAMGS